jgi:uncharacterized protein DUF3891
VFWTVHLTVYDQFVICNRTSHGWEIIYQRAHALLAAKLLIPLKDHGVSRWFETLNAVAQHDHGWQEWESLSTLNSRGEPRNFLDTPAQESVKQGRRAVQRALHQSIWCALLVARHVSCLYRDSEEECLQQLVAELEECRSQWRKHLQIDLEEEKATYQFLNWADTLSLMLCLEPNDRLGSVQPHLRGTAYELEGSGPERTLSPWPYSVDTLTVSTEAYHLKQKTFRSETELSRALREASPESKSWQLMPKDL